MIKTFAVLASLAVALSATLATYSAAEARGRPGGGATWQPFFCKDHPGECRVNKSGFDR